MESIRTYYNLRNPIQSEISDFGKGWIKKKAVLANTVQVNSVKNIIRQS